MYSPASNSFIGWTIHVRESIGKVAAGEMGTIVPVQSWRSTSQPGQADYRADLAHPACVAPLHYTLVNSITITVVIRGCARLCGISHTTYDAYI